LRDDGRFEIWNVPTERLERAFKLALDSTFFSKFEGTWEGEVSIEGNALIVNKYMRKGGIHLSAVFGLAESDSRKDEYSHEEVPDIWICAGSASLNPRLAHVAQVCIPLSRNSHNL
jgi:hypothetical protein